MQNPPPIPEVRVHFPGLNGLRFLAAFGVIIHHAEQLRQIQGRPHAYDFPFVSIVGSQGVTFFFVLSGFLITYLLLEERRRNGDVHVGRFYLRRILRIWPLYFAVVLLAFFATPFLPVPTLPGWADAGDPRYGHLLVLFLLMLPNLAVLIAPPVPYAAHAWSIGVEEQFYLVWPWILKRTRRVPEVLIGILVVWGLTRLVCAAIGTRSTGDLMRISQFIARFLDTTRIGCMAAGGIAAWLLFSGHPRLDLLRRRGTQALTLSLVAAGLTAGYLPPYFPQEAYAVMYGIIILNAASNPAALLLPDGRLMNFLGRISYGLYMFHPLCIGVSLSIFAPVSGPDPEMPIRWVAQVGTGILLTIGLSWLSYRFLESPFLRLKSRFAQVPSNEPAQ